MAAFHGKAGTVSFGAKAVFNVINWTINVTSDLAEATDMGDSWKTYLAGFKDWTGTAEVLTDSGGLMVVAGSSAINLVGTEAACIFNDGNTSLTANGFLVDFSVNDPSDGVVTMTLNFQGSGSMA